MKDWCMKHPFLTFLIIDEIITGIQTLIKGRDYLSTVDEIREGLGYVGKEAIRKEQEKHYANKDQIGFKVS